jgi:hypothetical protein
MGLEIDGIWLRVTDFELRTCFFNVDEMKGTSWGKTFSITVNFRRATQHSQQAVAQILFRLV